MRTAPRGRGVEAGRAPADRIGTTPTPTVLHPQIAVALRDMRPEQPATR